jgi:ribosomal protein S18 acetylase RimI-like enzyme
MENKNQSLLNNTEIEKTDGKGEMAAASVTVEAVMRVDHAQLKRMCDIDLSHSQSLLRATLSAAKLHDEPESTILLLANSKADSSVAVNPVGLLGFAFATFRGSSCFQIRNDYPDFLYLAYLSVDSSSQRQGVGRALVENLLQVAEQRRFPGVALHTATDNSVAIRLYEKCGFRRVTTLLNFYEDNADAFIYLKTFEP